MPLDQANWQINLLAADKTASAFRSVEQNMKRVDAQAKSASSAMSTGFGAASRALAPLAAAFSAAAIAQRIWAAGMKAADLGEQAEQIGLTTDQLQAYRLAAAQSGVSAEQLDASMMKLARGMGSANEGSEEMITRFERLGVKLLDGEGKLRKASDVMPEVARGLLAIGSETERSALMQELFGRSGSRLVTILEQIAQGNETLVAKTKAANALTTGETIRAWDEFDAKLKESGQVFDTFLAKFGAPVATVALDILLMKAAALITIGNTAKQAWDWISNGGNSSGVEATLDKMVQAQADLDKLRASGASQAVLDDVQGEIDKMNAELNAINSKAHAVTFPPITVTGDKPGVSNPAPKARGGGGSTTKTAKQDVDEVGKLIAKLQKEAESTAQTLENQFGDGTKYAADAIRDLNAVVTQSPVSDGTYDLALRAINERADDMGRAFRGAQGGVDGFMAGIEQGFADMAKANSAFEMGKQVVAELSQAFTDLASGAEVDFGRIVQSFANMLIQMEMQAALSNIFNAIRGEGSTEQGIFGSLIGGFFKNLFKAEGGPVSAGRGYVVGEKGPEWFEPGTSGTIIPNDAFRRGGGGGGGGGTTVIVQQTNHFGSDVSRSEFNMRLKEVESRTMQGAKAALMDDRRRGGPTKQTFK